MLKTAICILLSLPILGFSQSIEPVIQLSGIILDSNSGKGIPYAHLVIKSRLQGSISDFEGFFSLPVVKGDTIELSSVGYHTKTYIVPDVINNKYYSVYQDLEPDTLRVDEVILYPWPSKENFREEFLAIDPPITNIERAQRNLEINALLQAAMLMGDDSYAMQDYAIASQNNAIYNASMYYGDNGRDAVLWRLSSPYAWIAFFDALQNGDLKLRR